MTNLTRYNPLGEALSLRQAMDRLFEDSFVSPLSWRTVAGANWPAIDIHETPDEVVMTAALPGIKPEDVEITMVGQTLSMRGEFKADESIEQGRHLVQERRYGTFHRQIELPVRVQGDRAEASFENGLLTLHIPKAEEVKPRQIQIQAGSRTNVTSQAGTGTNGTNS